MGLFVREALRALLRNKLRSALTTLGIMIGIAAVVLVVAVGEAGSARAEAAAAGARRQPGVDRGRLAQRQRRAHRQPRHHLAHRSRTPRPSAARSPRSRRVAAGRRHRARLVVDAQLDDALPRRDARLPRHQALSPSSPARRSPTRTSTVAASKVLLGETVRRAALRHRQSDRSADPHQRPALRGDRRPRRRRARRRRPRPGRLDPACPTPPPQKKLRGGGLTWLDDILCSAIAPAGCRPRHRPRHGRSCATATTSAPARATTSTSAAPTRSSRPSSSPRHTLALLLVTIASISLLVGGIGIMNVMLASSPNAPAKSASASPSAPGRARSSCSSSASRSSSASPAASSASRCRSPASSCSRLRSNGRSRSHRSQSSSPWSQAQAWECSLGTTRRDGQRGWTPLRRYGTSRNLLKPELRGGERWGRTEGENYTCGRNIFCGVTITGHG